MVRQKHELQWAILDENILVVKKPKSMTWKQFIAFIFHSFRQKPDRYDIKEVLKGFKFKESKVSLDFSDFKDLT